MSRDPSPPRDCSVFRQGAGVSRAQMAVAAKFPSLWNTRLRITDVQTLFKISPFRSHPRNAHHHLNALEIRLEKNSNPQIADLGIGQSTGESPISLYVIHFVTKRPNLLI